MNEVEVKILEINSESIIEKLEMIGAKKIFEGNLVASFFDSDSGELQKANKTLRLRSSATEHTLTLKEMICCEEAKSVTENETLVDDVEAVQLILNGLGFTEQKRNEKHRISYMLEGVHFEIDTYPGIPTYLEIETTTVEEIKKRVLELGFSMEDAKPWTWKEVFEHYKK